MNISTLISILTLFMTAILSLLVLLENFKSRINQVFFLIGSSISLWITCNFLADLSRTIDAATFFSKSAIVWTAFLPFLFNILIKLLYFNQDEIFKKKFRTVNILSIFSIIIIVLFAPSSFNIQSVEIVYPFGISYIPGVLYYFLFLYLLIGFGFSFFYLFEVFRKFENPMKSQAQFMLTGTFITVFLAIVANIIAPVLGFSSFSVFGPPTIIFFVGFTAIAVLKHHLFSIKVIATELVIFALWIFILIRALIAEDVQGRLIEGGLLFVTIIVGILLIKSVIKEVKQREKIELLATDLQKANDRLKELDKQKSEFVSFATHQLRAPLTAMKGYASLILEGDLGELSQPIRDAITRVYDSSTTLANIVDDYLNISRIELGTMKYTFEPIDLKELITNVIGELKPNIEKSKLQFSFIADENKKYIVNADKDKFKQIISNLIDNSIKYTPSGSVTVALEKKASSEGSKILFSVKDTGIGIDPEVMPKLFAKFSRATNGTKQNIHGTGLGLFVAKEIVTAHKGKIWAESKGEGKGTEMYVELEEKI